MPTAKQAPIDQEGNNNTTSTNVGNATNTNNNKRKDVSLATNNNIVDTKNVIQNVNSGGASSTNKRQRPSDEDDSSSLDDSCSKEISVVDILFPIEGPELPEETLRALASKQGWVFGIGQRNIATIQRALFDRYDKLDNGVDKLKEDIAAINNGEYSSDSDSDDELEEINKKSLVATEEDDWDFSFDNDGDDESTNGTTDGLGESSTSIPPLHDNAQSSTTTTTLKLDISCTGNGVKDDDGNGVKVNETNGVEDNRNDPSPANVEADLSAYNNDDISPPSNNDSHDEDECYETLSSPKKGEGLLNTPTTATTPQTIQTSPSSAFTANLGKESEIYEDQAPSNHGMLLQQFQQQQHQLSFPPPQYDRATLESMRDEEQHLTGQIQQKEWLMQQREQQQWNLQERQIVQQWMLLQQHQLQQLKKRLLYILQQQRQFAHAQQQLLQQQQRYQQMQYLQFLRQQTQFKSLQDLLQLQQQGHNREESPLLLPKMTEERKCGKCGKGKKKWCYHKAEWVKLEDNDRICQVCTKAADPPMLNQQQQSSQSSYGGGKLVRDAAASSEYVPQCCEPELEEEINPDGEVVKQQCQGGCGRMLGKNHFTKTQWKKGRKCMKCLLPRYISLFGSVEKATEYIAQEMNAPQTSEVENGNKRRRRKKKKRSIIVIPSPPELQEEFKVWLKENPKKEKEWEASKRLEQAQHEAARVATNNFKPSREFIKKWDKEWVRQRPNGFRRYMYHLRYDLDMGLEGDQAYLPLMCFDLHHNSDEAVKKKQEDKVKLNGRCDPSELTYEELVERSHLLTLLTRTDHALETWGEVPKVLSGGSACSRRYRAVVAFENSILGTRCTMSGEVLPDHIFDGHHRTEKCDLQEGDTVYSTAKVCGRDGLYDKCPKKYIPWRNRLFNEVLKKTRLKKEWHKILHWVLRNLDWFASQGIIIDYPYKVDGTVLVWTASNSNITNKC